MARLKSDRFSHYRNNDARLRWSCLQPKTEQDLRATLMEGGSNHKHVVPGGAWWQHTEIWKAERDGDTKRAEKLKAEINRSLALMGLG
jgi:hypothetical protein